MISAVIFDLDGVVVTTDKLHYLAWKELAEKIGIRNCTEADNIRQRGVSRMESLEVLLEKSDKCYTKEEKIALADEKNRRYVKLLETLSETDVLPGVKEFIAFLKKKSIKTAIGSASKNTYTILEKIKMTEMFDAVSCGLDITRSKPDPEVFLIAAEKLGIQPERCLVVEDSDAGITAAKAAGMYALAVGAAKNNSKADFSAESIETALRFKLHGCCEG